MTRGGSDNGFTLVEMLVSMALLAIAAVLVAQSFTLERGGLLRIEARAADGEDVAAAQDLIRARIQHLFAQARYDGTGVSVDMDGAPDRLAFQAATPDLSRPVGWYRLQLSSAGDLILIALEGESQSNGRPMVLLHGVQNLEFGYFGPPSAEASGWRSGWLHASAPPQLVRMRLTFAEKDRRVWPELIVRPAATVDQACALDADTGLCRGRG